MSTRKWIPSVQAINSEGEEFTAQRGYYEVTCNCGKKVHVMRDGQSCFKCGQMYNGVGEEITHRGYDSFGDTDEW